MKINKQEFFLIIGAIVVALVFTLTVLLSLIKSDSRHLSNVGTVPTPTIDQLNRTSVSIKYNEASQGKIIEKLLRPPILTNNDALIRNSLLVPLNGSAGDIYTTPDVTVSYLPAIKEFQGEIKTASIDLAKKEAIDWLRTQGMSQQGICNLPLEFFLNNDVINNPKLQNITFDSLPPGC
jgi:hypothetical protein